MITAPTPDAWSGDAAPAWWYRARQVYDAAAVASGSISLESTLAATATIGRLVHRLPRSYPSPEILGKLIPGDPQHLASIARRMVALRYQNRALVPIVGRGGPAVLHSLFEAETHAVLQRIKGPAIIATWHSGPAYGLGAALVRAGMPAFALRRTMPRAGVQSLEYGLTHGSTEDRAHTFARALAHLRQGGVVAMAVDVADVALTSPIPCLNRMVRLARGPFALARLTGASLVPAVATWTSRGEIAIVAGNVVNVVNVPTASADRDAETIAAADLARFLDTSLRARPHEIWFCMLRWLLESPGIGATQANGHV